MLDAPDYDPGVLGLARIHVGVRRRRLKDAGEGVCFGVRRRAGLDAVICQEVIRGKAEVGASPRREYDSTRDKARSQRAPARSLAAGPVPS